MKAKRLSGSSMNARTSVSMTGHLVSLTARLSTARQFVSWLICLIRAASRAFPPSLAFLSIPSPVRFWAKALLNIRGLGSSSGHFDRNQKRSK